MKVAQFCTADRIAIVEVGIVVLAAPPLLFPAFHPGLTAAACAALLAVWITRWIATRRPGTSTALDVPLLLLALAVPFAVWASAIPELTLPKLAGLVLGLAAFRATANVIRTRRHLGIAVALYLALGLGLVTFGLVSTAWLHKWAALDPVLARIPRLVVGLPGAEEGIQPNELGGTLLLLLPLSLTAALVGWSERRKVACATRLAALLLTLLFGAVLVLTQSRSAWIGMAAGLAAMVWIRWRSARWLIVVTALVLALGLLYLGPGEILASLFPETEAGAIGTMASTVTLQGRLEIWNRALYAIQDFSFTGTGLGTFRQVVQLLYPLFLIGPGADIGHAHNVFLQVALDLGIPGLIAYLALVGVALWIAWRLAQSPPAGGTESGSQVSWLALGIVGALVAFHVYGLTDAIALGAKPGVVLWLLLGITAALWAIAPRRAASPAASDGPPGVQTP